MWKLPVREGVRWWWFGRGERVMARDHGVEMVGICAEYTFVPAEGAERDMIAVLELCTEWYGARYYVGSIEYIEAV